MILCAEVDGAIKIGCLFVECGLIVEQFVEHKDM